MRLFRDLRQRKASRDEWHEEVNLKHIKVKLYHIFNVKLTQKNYMTLFKSCPQRRIIKPPTNFVAKEKLPQL